MFLQKQFLPLLSLVVICGAMLAGCVDIPSDQPPMPALNAEFRFLSINPASAATPTTVPFAEGVDANYQLNKVFNPLAIGSNGNETAFQVFQSGTKRFIYNNDTIVVSFETDQHATLVFYRNSVPDADTSSPRKARFFYMKMPIRAMYTSASVLGTENVTSVRFVNLVNGGLDTLSVWRDSLSADPTQTAVATLGFGKGTSTFQQVRLNQTAKFFFARTTTAGRGRVVKDSIAVAGGSHQILSVFVYDKYDTTAASTNRTALVQVKKLIEN
ncbi:MAG: hypothetical protein NTV54_12605 [Ignavibacteriales bacterium]|nr:hypothetical protein [Ignavibacteriales bacterium]